MGIHRDFHLRTLRWPLVTAESHDSGFSVRGFAWQPPGGAVQPVVYRLSREKVCRNQLHKTLICFVIVVFRLLVSIRCYRLTLTLGPSLCIRVFSTDSAARKQLGFSLTEAQIDDVLADSPPWDCIYPEDRKVMIDDMKQRKVEKSQLIQKEEDPNCPLYIILKGVVNIYQPVGWQCIAVGPITYTGHSATGA